MALAIFGKQVLFLIEKGMLVGEILGLWMVDGDTREQLVQHLVVPDGELEMTGDDPRLLVVTGGVAAMHVDGGTCSDTLGVVALPQQTGG